MNWISFLDLMHEIYSKDKPDLKKIERKGLLAVKIAQTYALRVDFLNATTCQHLSRLFRHTTNIPTKTIRTIVDETLPESVRVRIHNLSDAPLGSASVGQVHTAQLSSGEEVIVKVIKKDVRKQFVRDIKGLRTFVKIILLFYPKLRKVADPLGVLDHIKDYTLKELDLRSESTGQQVLKDIYEAEKDTFNLKPLRFPRIYEKYSNDTVMIAERIKGKTFDDLLSSKELPYERLIDLFRIHGYYIFKCGIFHGDIHPGNIMLAEDGAIYLIDTSAIATVPPVYRQGLFSFFDALTQFDYDACLDSLQYMSKTKLTNVQFQKYRIFFHALYKDFETKTVSDVSLTRQMMRTIKSAIEHGMDFQKGIFAIIKSFMYLDGMVLACKPDANILRDMRPFMPQLRSLVKEKGSTCV